MMAIVLPHCGIETMVSTSSVIVGCGRQHVNWESCSTLVLPCLFVHELVDVSNRHAAVLCQIDDD